MQKYLKMIVQAARENLKGADLQDRHAGSSTISQQLRTYILIKLNMSQVVFRQS